MNANVFALARHISHHRRLAIERFDKLHHKLHKCGDTSTKTGGLLSRSSHLYQLARRAAHRAADGGGTELGV
jgi:hypothetical protein